jgi:hypothetical protein
MPTFLSDPPISLYAILALAIVISGSVWISRRSRKSLVVFGCIIMVTVGVFLLDRLFESPREESGRRVQEMVKAANDRDANAFLSHVADKIQYQGESATPSTITKDELRKSGLWELLRHFNIRVAAWDFDPADVTHVDENTIEIGFLAKGEADSKQVPMYLRATFSRQSDGQMKLTKLASFDPIKRTNEPKTIPNFP